MKFIESLKNYFKLRKIYDIGEFDDGYHSFNSLYHQRAILFATIVKANKGDLLLPFRVKASI